MFHFNFGQNCIVRQPFHTTCLSAVIWVTPCDLGYVDKMSPYIVLSGGKTLFCLKSINRLELANVI